LKESILITGANGGVGAALVKSFREEDYIVIASDITRKNVECDYYIQQDLALLVGDENIANDFFSEVKKASTDSPLKAIVNNAAIQILGDIKSLDVGDLQKTFNINILAPYAIVKGLHEDLCAHDGVVVNIGSIHAACSKPGFLAYATSKAALKGLSQSLALELGGKVRVNIIQPAAIKTDMLVDGFNDSNKLSELGSMHPVGRIALPSEIADVALFLVSDRSSFITGAVINVDGGISVRLRDPE